MIESIERVELTHLQIPLKEPFRISAGEVAVKDAILVCVQAGGLTGVGESSAMAAGFGYSPDTPERCWDELTGRIAPSLLGRSIANIEEIASLTEGWSGASSFSIAGAETALWDLLAQAGHSSLAEFMGTSPDFIERGVESGLAVGLYPNVIDLLRTIESHLTEGYRRVKIKITHDRDVELVRAVRQHFGEIDLMVDANGAYTVADLDVFRALDDFDLLMFEQPMAAGDLGGLAKLQAAVVTPVCLDETAETVESTAEALRRGCGRIVNLKIQRVGGFGPALAILELCRTQGVACWVGTMPELGVGQAQGLHLATLGNCKYPTDVEPSARWFVDDCVSPLIEMSAPGLFRIPARAGLGYQLDQAKLKRYQVRHEMFGG